MLWWTLRQLGSQDEEQAARAKEKLLSSKDRAVAPLLAGLKKKKNLLMALRAVELLGEIRNPVAIEALVEALEDPTLRGSAIEALAKIGSPRTVDSLVQLLKQATLEQKRGAAEALSIIGDSRAVDALLGALAEPDMELRSWAAEALGEIGDPRAVDPMLAALKDKESSVRSAVRNALGNFREARQDVEEVLERYEEEQRSAQHERERQRAAAIEECGKGNHNPHNGGCTTCGKALSPESIREGWYFLAYGGLGDRIYGKCTERLDKSTIMAYCRSRLSRGETGSFRIANISKVISAEEYYAGIRDT